MLRLPPSLLTLSAVEIQDFTARQKLRLRAARTGAVGGSLELPTRLNRIGEARKYKQSQSNQVASENDGALNRTPEIQRAGGSAEFMSDGDDPMQETHPLLGRPGEGVDSHMQEAFEDPAQDWLESNYQTLPQSPTEGSTGDVGGPRGEFSLPDRRTQRSSCEDEGHSQESDPSYDQENEHQFLPVSQDASEDIGDEHHRHNKSYSPSKHRFDYGGFVESHTPDSSSFSRPHKSDNPANSDGSLTVPDDSSTPFAVNEVQRLRLRLPLPRSPLHISELVANSPERSHNLAPRLSSYGAPSLLLAQPPRRTPKSYRPRTVSYSYDESERTSAGNEEPQMNVSNDEFQPDVVRSDHPVTLYEELSTSSFNSERSGNVPSQAGSTSPEPVIVHNTEAQRTFYFSSPPLPGVLPPPFSTVPRRTSIAASIPSTHSLDGYKSDESGILVEDSPSPPRRNDAAESSQSVHRSGGTLNRLGRMFSGRFKSRSPISPEPSSPRTNSSPTTPRQSAENSSNLSQSPNATPTRHSLRVYDDSLPPSSQPQTPAHLPESRHRSRLHPSYTAPVTRRGPGIFNSSPHSSMRITESVRIRRTGGRSDSPVGMGGERGEGFRGLYGGQENADDDLLFENAARRLWDTGRPGSARRRGSDATPEREMTIADMRREHP